MIGVAMAAFDFRPATPYQVASKTKGLAPSRDSTELCLGKNVAGTHEQSVFVDAWLDNSDIEADMNIHPARKCSVCIG
eukprot:CAMPEP_0195522308 /NCGR_PEP_ID=MMETSP0794_2-20130614/20346_1 /TAXON_ID=515487 /ORGANISM="Stephanopyxis turris, Strain CCMP 815" /LENGTH=77 /DNA_ID=CAMNT_0040652029 /DNA_START=93 /DNA_END=326 /DNA_ORIENTATION=+